ncbi:hypothetical protein K6X14_03340 [Xanthomonas euvesicatoria pv. allii]|nr:hypothetical protein [Xanthomonas euvesicatoria pv. allii]RTE58649.1 hypothetical protein EI541_07410 [Xanthomonas axonopodis pv. eucalyptorum]
MTIAPKTRKYSRMPTTAEISAFTGMHCHALYAEAVAQNWHCPSCKRHVYELIRWTEIRGPSWRQRFGDEHGMGFTIVLTKHHCHGHGRFAQTLICGDCNSADGAVKRKLRLPTTWSFSPQEIGQFVTVAPHSGQTTIDYVKARELYELGGFW